MEKDRMNYLIYDVEFDTPYGVLKEDVSLPIEVFMSAIRDYVDKYFNVSLDGTDSDIVEFLSQINPDYEEVLTDDDRFMEDCKRIYNASIYKEEDKDIIVDNYEYENNLGLYKEEPEDEE